MLPKCQQAIERIGEHPSEEKVSGTVSPEDRRQGHSGARARLRRGPNKGLELTAYSVRSCLAPASSSSSGLALDAKVTQEKLQDNLENRA